MADKDQLEWLRKGAEVWNAWRTKNPSIRPNLSKAYLNEASLAGANLSEASLGGANLGDAYLIAANLRNADLSGTNLSNADLSGADLSNANLSKANLREADLSASDLSNAGLIDVNLRYANLHDVNLSNADLSGANLSNAGLSEANLSGAFLYRAILSEANLNEAKLHGAKLNGTDLSQANLIDACLDHADLTGVRLWESQRGGWSIKEVICQHAFWDRKGEERIEYGEGEFERIFAEKPHIVLRYKGGISPIDLIALPLIVERLQADHPGSVLQVRSVQNDAGGASVTITVEDLTGRSLEEFAAEMEAVRGELLTTQQRLLNEEKLRFSFEAQCQVLVERVIPALAAAPKQQVNIGHLTAPMSIEGTVMNKGDTFNISGQAGAVGPGARAHDNSFQQIQSGIDLPKVAEELGRLRDAMKEEATGTREQDKAIGAVADAEDAAAKGDGPATLRYLKGAGTWALGIAERIGVAIATEALKRAI